MRPPCPCRCGEGTDRRAVFGYGDANADFHVIGDHPGVHGGAETGVPFTGTDAGERLLSTLDRADVIEYEEDPQFEPRSTFVSYRYPCCLGAGDPPDGAAYREFDRFLDSELRAISAHVLMPVGERTTRHVVEDHTAAGHRIEYDMDDLHATELRGRGFLVMPVADPAGWTDHDERLIEALDALRERDYHQMVDLGRFIPDAEPYFVR